MKTSSYASSKIVTVTLSIWKFVIVKKKKRKRGAYSKSANQAELKELKEFHENMYKADGELKYQALYDHFRASSTPEFRVGHIPRSINPEGEELWAGCDWTWINPRSS